jgi:S-(hydroxymethyl)glutathione dehydrogenase/alcohol dehydrogenase
VIVTGLGDITEVGVPIPIGELTLFDPAARTDQAS